MKRLILWDIDRTLLSAGAVGRAMFADAFQIVVGRPLEHLPEMGGKTDHALVEAVFMLHDISVEDGQLAAFFNALAASAHDRREEMERKGQALDGAAAALDAMAAVDGVVQSVVTGNIPSVAKLKLASFGLDAHIDFEVGGYGSEAADRAVLVRSARERAEAKYQQQLSGRQVVVLGDTPHDIAGAKANGAVAIGIATGSSSVAELWAAGADVVLPSLADTEAVIQAMHFGSSQSGSALSPAS